MVRVSFRYNADQDTIEMFRIKPPPQRLGNRRIPGRRMHAPSSDTPPLNQTNHAKRRIPEPAPSLCVRGWGAVYRSSTPLLSNSSVHVGLIGFWKSLSCSSLKFWGQGDGVSRQFSVVIKSRDRVAHTWTAGAQTWRGIRVAERPDLSPAISTRACREAAGHRSRAIRRRNGRLTGFRLRASAQPP